MVKCDTCLALNNCNRRVAELSEINHDMYEALKYTKTLIDAQFPVIVGTLAYELIRTALNKAEEK